MAKLPKFLQVNENDSEEEKKKKKFLLILFPVISILIVIGIILAILFGVKGCSSNGNNAHEHVWGVPTYTWTSDYSSCTAERVCKGDASHKETETANSTYNVVSEAKCEEDGTGRYYVSFENEAFAAQTKDIAIDALEHDYQFDSFVWTDFTAQAKYVCIHDVTHVQLHDATVTNEVTTQPGCETEGVRTYTATYKGYTDTKTEVVPAKDHHWGIPTYVWAADKSTCTATRVCTYDDSHVDTEIVNSVLDVQEPATCTQDGYGKYTATFTKTGFEAQEEYGVIARLGHDYQFVEFVWDGFTAQAKYVCSHDAAHVELHDAEITNAVTTEPGCETTGVRTYTASYGGHTDTKTDAVDATGHSWGAATYVWADDYSTCTAERICLNDATHIESETVDSSYVVVTPATKEDEGLGRYTATFTKSAFTTQIVDVVLDKLDIYGQTPKLSEDGKTLTYGLYPQTNINDSTLVTALNGLTTPESNGWYLYEDDYYAKVSATPNDSSYVFDNGTTIVSGTTYWFKCEPITWNVLNNNAGQCYVVSSVLLDAHCYYNSTSTRTIGGKTIYPTNYEYSDIRTWLNADFYNSAFALGNSYIQTTTVDNSASTTSSSSNSYACNNTQDKVFLPSFQDYRNSSYGFSTSTGSTDTRCCRTTDWARARGAYYYTSSGSHHYNGFYWTRSPDSGYSNYPWGILDDGFLYAGSVCAANCTYDSVRPAISITIA